MVWVAKISRSRPISVASCTKRSALRANRGSTDRSGRAIAPVAVVQAANTLIAYEAFQQLQHIWRDHPDQLGQGLRQKLSGAAQLSLNDVHSARVQADVWQQQVSALLAEQVDVLMWPGREALPETLQALMANPTGQRSACNRLFSLTGHPALTCPMGVSSQGLPMALQIGAAMHIPDGIDPHSVRHPCGLNRPRSSGFFKEAT